MTQIRLLPVSIVGYRQPPAGYPFSSVDILNRWSITGDTVVWTESGVASHKAQILTEMDKAAAGITKSVSYASHQTLSEHLATDAGEGSPLLSRLDEVYYDLEQWAQSRGEDADIPGSALAFKGVAVANGLGYMGGISGQLQQGTNVADFSQHMQEYSLRWLGYPERRGGIDAYAYYLAGVANDARAGNPGIPVSPMISLTAGFRLRDIRWFFRYLNANIDGGISSMAFFHTNSVEGMELLNEFLQGLRSWGNYLGDPHPGGGSNNRRVVRARNALVG